MIAGGMTRVSKVLLRNALLYKHMDERRRLGFACSQHAPKMGVFGQVQEVQDQESAPIVKQDVVDVVVDGNNLAPQVHDEEHVGNMDASVDLEHDKGLVPDTLVELQEWASHGNNDDSVNSNLPGEDNEQRVLDEKLEAFGREIDDNSTVSDVLDYNHAPASINPDNSNSSVHDENTGIVSVQDFDHKEKTNFVREDLSTLGAEHDVDAVPDAAVGRKIQDKGEDAENTLPVCFQMVAIVETPDVDTVSPRKQDEQRNEAALTSEDVGTVAIPTEPPKMERRMRPVWKIFVALHSSLCDTFVVTMRAKFPEKRMKFLLNTAHAGYIFMLVIDIPTFDAIEEFIALCRLVPVGRTPLYMALARGTNPTAFVDYVPIP